ncbi:MAG: flagellar hook-basal body complex protein, partial [Lachnospiraceae bacterium]|nr:flagellar hook-basal body complex protein [Lachnospiraceae bacterium]
MMRSLFSGVSGLKTHQTRMDVIGNNIANVNTVGYKSSSMQFQDTVSQTLQNATGPNEATGRAGMNARQIGLGVNTAAIYSNITAAGAPETTGNPFDVRLNGDSFFVVSDGSNQYYTRSGAFTVDTNGTLAMQSNGYTVQGYGTTTQMVNGAQEITIDTSSLTSLDIMSKENSTYEAAATTNAYITGIIDDSDSNVSTRNGHGLTMEVYDNRGNAYTIRLRISNQNWTAADPASTKANGTYYISVSDIIGPDKKS